MSFGELLFFSKIVKLLFLLDNVVTVLCLVISSNSNLSGFNAALLVILLELI